MNVGEEILISEEFSPDERRRSYSLARNWSLRYGKEFLSRKTPEGYRIKRVA
jgi:hypothetical protein